MRNEFKNGYQPKHDLKDLTPPNYNSCVILKKSTAGRGGKGMKVYALMLEDSKRDGEDIFLDVFATREAAEEEIDFLERTEIGNAKTVKLYIREKILKR